MGKIDTIMEIQPFAYLFLNIHALHMYLLFNTRLLAHIHVLGLNLLIQAMTIRNKVLGLLVGPIIG